MSTKQRVEHQQAHEHEQREEHHGQYRRAVEVLEVVGFHGYTKVSIVPAMMTEMDSPMMTVSTLSARLAGRA